ncbi:MAG: ribosome small subunit-dependent GTPase A [Bacteroidales bacterium]|nr:ribosome small subunit-dependent GTPase A [Bacteroidales bacterium]
MKGEATVVKNAGSHFLLSCLPEWELFPAVLRGKIRLKGSSSTNPVAVGDVVSWEWDETGRPGSASEDFGNDKPCSAPPATAGKPALITGIRERKNYLIRKSTNLSRQSHVIAANVDEAFIIVSLYFPEIKLPFLDRILLTCEVYNVKPIIVLNKLDLYRDQAPESIKVFHEIYEGAGYRIIETSAVTGEGIDELREACKGKICLLSGESGVGKSSLVRAIDPKLDLKVGDISEVHLQGKHTTSLYEMYRAECGAYIIDTPGLRGFGLVDLKKEEIALYFPEMFKLSRNCRFSPCTHTHEPGCAVKAAVEDGIISPERYSSYLGMLEEDSKFR